jgi:hypothetical protein
MTVLLSITSELGRLETFFSDVVYPIWPLWLAVFLVAAAATGFAAYRLGWHRVALQHRVLSGIAVAGIVAVSVPVGWYTISPLFDRNTVCEASPIPGAGAGSEKCEDVVFAATNSPTASPAPAAPTTAPTPGPTTAASPTPAQFEPHAVRQGEFVSADDFHFTYGNALLIETAPGNYTLRFEDFSVRNGPDVFVLLSPTNDYGEGALNLGSLKGTDGAFNYEVPPGTDVSQYKSAVIWCRQFDVLFGHAELM